MPAVKGSDPRRRSAAPSAPAEGQRRRLDDGDPSTHGRRGCGDLEADQARADHREAHAGRQGCAQGARVVERPQLVDAGSQRGRGAGAGRPCTQQPQPPRAGTGRDEQPVVAQALAAVQHDLAPPASSATARMCAAQIDVMLGVPTRRAQRGFVALAGEQRLGQRWAVVGGVRSSAPSSAGPS